MRVEQLILRNLIYNENYLRKVLPFLDYDYFNGIDKIIFKQVSEFVETYNSPPSIEALSISIKEKKNLSDDEVEKCEDYLEEVQRNSTNDTKEDWLIDRTEKFCQEKAVYNAILNSLSILDGKDKKHEKGSIPKILSDALAVSFDTSVGHDYLENSDERYEFYHRTESRIPFDLDFFNKITKGGLPNKTLNIAQIGRAHV